MKGCENCYYKYFDARAYPCSLCIRGIERQDRWMPSKKTKTESQTSGVVWTKNAIKNEPKSYTTWASTDEPQIRCSKCGRTDYIKDLEKDFGVKDNTFKYKCINCNTYIKNEPQTERNIK